MNTNNEESKIVVEKKENSTDSGMGEILIDSCDTLDESVILSERCYKYHTNTDFKNQDDVNTRVQLYNKGYIESTIENPIFIYQDPSNPKKRHRYFNVFYDNDISQHLMGCIVVVEYKRDPKEIVTWHPTNKMTKEKIINNGGGMIYANDEKQ